MNGDEDVIENAAGDLSGHWFSSVIQLIDPAGFERFAPVVVIETAQGLKRQTRRTWNSCLCAMWRI